MQKESEKHKSPRAHKSKVKSAAQKAFGGKYQQ